MWNTLKLIKNKQCKKLLIKLNNPSQLMMEDSDLEILENLD